MDAFKDMSITDLLFFSTMVLAWLHMAYKAYHWFGIFMLRRGWRWWNRKDDIALAMDSFYEAFNLSTLEQGSSLIVKTEGGLVIQVYRPKAVRDA